MSLHATSLRTINTVRHCSIITVVINAVTIPLPRHSTNNAAIAAYTIHLIYATIIVTPRCHGATSINFNVATKILISSFAYAIFHSVRHVATPIGYYAHAVATISRLFHN